MYTSEIALKVLAIYIPSLVGLLAIELYFLNLFKEAIKIKSGAKNTIFAVVLLLISKLIGWGAVVVQTIILVNEQHLLIPSWEVLFVPLFWAISNITILLLLFKEPNKI